MNFLVDRCAGARLAAWLEAHGHDVGAAWEIDPDPGDAELLRLAAAEQRILVTIDSDFGTLVFLFGAAMRGSSGCRTFPPPAELHSWSICWRGTGLSYPDRS